MKEVHKEKIPPSPQRNQSKVISSTEGVLMNLKNQKVKIEDIKKGLFRNLKVNVSKIDDIAIEKLPFWHDVFCKDFSKKIDDNFANQNLVSKGEIMNLHNKFKWCSDDRKCKSLVTNQFQVDLNFSEIVYSYFLVSDNNSILVRPQSYESIRNENTYDEIYDKPVVPRPRSSQFLKDDNELIVVEHRVIY